MQGLGVWKRIKGDGDIEGNERGEGQRKKRRRQGEKKSREECVTRSQASLP